MLPRILTAILALTGAAGVAAGAYGAHAGGFDAYDQSLWETAVLYTLTHAAVGVAVSLAIHRLGLLGILSALAFTFGIAGFAGSLMVLAHSGTSLGLVAPIGGTLLILGWVFLALGALIKRVR